MTSEVELSEDDFQALAAQQDLLTAQMTSRLSSFSSTAPLAVSIFSLASVVGYGGSTRFLVVVAPAAWLVLTFLMQHLGDLSSYSAARKRVQRLLSRRSVYHLVTAAVDDVRSNRQFGQITGLIIGFIAFTASSGASVQGFHEAADIGGSAPLVYLLATIAAFLSFVTATIEYVRVKGALNRASVALGIPDSFSHENH